MNRPDKLYELVQSMSMSEKRYFRIFASRHTIGKKNKYLQLFDLLEAAETFESDVFGEELKRKGLNIKHLASDKHYLYNLILRGLSNFHTGKTASLKIKETLISVELLHERGLIHQGLELLMRAKKQAIAYDLDPLILEISRWERKIQHRIGTVEQVQGALNEAIETLAQFDNKQAFLNLYYRMLRLQERIGKVRTAEDAQALEDLMSHPFLQDETIALSFQAQLNYWRIHAMHHYGRDDIAGEYAANERLAHLMDSNENYAQEFPYEYVVIYSRMLDIQRYADEQTFLQALSQLRSFPLRLKKKRRDVEARVLHDGYTFETIRRIEFGEMEKARALIPEMEEFLRTHKKHLNASQLIRFPFQFAYIHIGLDDPRAALPYINEILNEYPQEVRPDLHLYTRLLNLITHYDLENFTVLRYQVDGTHRFLKRRKGTYWSEQIVIHLFRKLARRGHSADSVRIDLMRQARTELEEGFADPFERKMLNFFDILSWLDARIEGETFGEAKQKRLATQSPEVAATNW